MATEELTMTDKAQRDRLYNQLRASKDPLERQVVKSSSSEPILGEDGKPTGKHRSTWSVHYPTS